MNHGHSHCELIQTAIIPAHLPSAMESGMLAQATQPWLQSEQTSKTNKDYVAFLVERIADAVVRANNNIAPARIVGSAIERHGFGNDDNYNLYLQI